MKSRISKATLSVLFVANFLIVMPLANACAPGEGRGVSVNATTGEQITYCIPAAPAPGVDYNPQTNPSAPPAETVLTREQAAQQRRDYEAAAAAAAAIERDRIAASTPVVPRVIDPTDPLPTIASGEKVPGTVVSGQQEITCPAGSGRGIEVNATTVAVSTSCIKNFVPQAELDARALQDKQIKTAQEEAKKLSEEWNAANPGRQKCFSYSIGNQSGGVCANPVKVVTEEQITVTTKTPLPTILASAEFEYDNFVIYPNPSTDIFNVKIGDMQPQNIEVTDISGKILFSKKEFDNSGGEIQINLSNVAKGVYFIKLATDKKSVVKKIVKN